MSLFRKPKKPISRRVFSAEDDANRMAMEVDEDDNTSPKSHTEKRKDKKSSKSNKVTSKNQLLSFDDEEDEGEIFQVKKSSHSKKVMKQLDKERRRKEKKDTRPSDDGRSGGAGDTAKRTNDTDSKMVKDENPSTDISIIRTDDFVLVVKKSEPDILNGRAALCAGRDDMTSDEEEDNTAGHRFNKPDQFKIALESGVIPDAAMIFAARKRRQKAREESDFIPVVEEEPKKGKRNIREDECSDDEGRIVMSAVTGYKEREDRKEQFYSVQQEYSGDESEENESHEWENQQIRKGVTGAQLMSAQQETVYSQYMIQPFMNSSKEMSTAEQLQEAYARSGVDHKPKARKLQFYAPTNQQPKKNEPKPKDTKKLRMPQEIAAKLSEKLETTKTLHAKHLEDIDKMMAEIKLLRLEVIDAKQKAPVAAAKYRFYQEIKCYMTDLIECMDDKLPKIVALEQRFMAIMSKHHTALIERRRQDVRDQAKEMADAMKSTSNSSKKTPEDHERIRRAAEREGRRTRRRRDREKSDQDKSHLDGMSSDDEIADQDHKQLKIAVQQLCAEAAAMFEDAADEYSQIPDILDKLANWKCQEFDSYKDAYISLCVPKILGPLIRLKLIVWNPLAQCEDFEKMQWYSDTLRFGYNRRETENSLANDLDVRLVPALVEKILLPKLTEIIENCWDPLSTTQTLKLVQLISRLGRDYPSLRVTSKSLRALFTLILDKMKVALDNDVFIPIMKKQSMQEARSSFFQRQFCSGLKLFRNFLSWQGIIADAALKELAVTSLLNRYLLSAMRVCTPIEATNKAFLALYTLPRVWLQSEDMLVSLEMFIIFVKHLEKQLDRHNPIYLDSIEKVGKILKSLHAA